MIYFGCSFWCMHKPTPTDLGIKSTRLPTRHVTTIRLRLRLYDSDYDYTTQTTTIRLSRHNLYSQLERSTHEI